MLLTTNLQASSKHQHEHSIIDFQQINCFHLFNLIFLLHQMVWKQCSSLLASSPKLNILVAIIKGGETSLQQNHLVLNCLIQGDLYNTRKMVVVFLFCVKHS